MFNNQFGVPLPLAVWLATDDYQYAKYPNELSATTLLKSSRYIMNAQRTMYPEAFPEHLRPIVVESVNPEDYPDLQDRIANRVGTAIHEAVEKAWKNNAKPALLSLGYPQNVVDRVVINPEPADLKPDSVAIYSENRMYREIEVEGHKFTISGQYDMIVEGYLHDIKTTSTYSYETGCNDDKYMLQGSIYRWLNPELITGDTLTINFVFLDWKKFQANASNEKYPPAKAFKREYKLLSLEETEMFIRNKLKIHVQHLESPLELIPCCGEKELFSSPPTFKYYKTGYEEGKRATKNFDTLAEASKYRAEKGHYEGDIVEYRGNPFMCPCCNPDEVMALTMNINKANKLVIS